MPLTTTGITIQVMASIRAWREHREKCTVNDCKVVVNRLLRVFSEPLKDKALWSDEALRRPAGLKLIKDHALPVDVLVMKLFQLTDAELELSDANIARLQAFIRQSLMVVTITSAENSRLDKKKLTSKMPAYWTDPAHALYGNPLARYAEAGITLAEHS